MQKHSSKLLMLIPLAASFTLLNSPVNAGEPIRLESTIVGDKEQPTVSYFVPWQGVGAPDQMNGGVENRYDRSLSKVDREVLMRSKGIYEQMKLEFQRLQE